MTLKYCLNLTLTALLLFEINISNVMANDCDNLNNVMKYMGDNMKQDYSKHTNCCQFKGIICDNQQRITEIQFKNLKDYSIDINSAIGEMGNLQSLTSLEITNVVTATDDSLTSKIGDLKNLKTLIIKDNYIDFLGTPLPQEIGNLKNLERLELTGNSFNGPIPKSLGNLENLKVLNLKDNAFEGTIPYEFKNLLNLEEFNVYGSTKLNGYVPLLPKVKSCDYGVTDLCSIKSSKCKSSLDDCTKEEIVNTNKANGNPNPSDESQFEEKNRDNSDEELRNFGIIATLIIFAIIICVIFGKSIKRHRSKNSDNGDKSESEDESEDENNNISGNATGVAVPTYTTTPNTNINVNINANLSPYSEPVQTVDITNSSMLNGPSNGYVDITTPYDSTLTPYTSNAASPTPVSPSANDYYDTSNNLPPTQQQTYEQNHISPSNPSTYNNNSMFAGPANGYVDITTPYDNDLTPYTSNATSTTPVSSSQNDNYYPPTSTSLQMNNNYSGPNNIPPPPPPPSGNYNQIPVSPIGFVPPPAIAYPPSSNYNNKQ
ncbi:hypothetical protein U3516DRAFT_823707 [Neocallimastix sp. 'constans']|jgi:hypothetical protein